LVERLESWKSSPPADIHLLAEAVAETLAERAGQFAPPLQAVAFDLATRVLRLPVATSTPGYDHAVACCEQILRMKRAADGNKEKIVGETFARNRPPDLTIALNIGGVDKGLAGGGLPVDVLTPPLPPARHDLPAPSAPPWGTMEQTMVADQRAKPVPQEIASREPETLQLLTSLAPLPKPWAPAMETGLPAPLPQCPPQRMSLAEARASFDRASRRAASNQAMVASAEGIRELIRQMHTGDGREAAKAREELARHGFTGVHFDLAKRLSDPTPEVRQELARTLVGLPGVDAAPWLLWLAADEDAEVRLTAITLIATSGAPDLLAQAEDLANRDTDPRIRRQAEQIARLRR
jgi:hypothetical protein